MVTDRGRWCFSSESSEHERNKGNYPEIQQVLRTLLTNLISSRILIPKRLDYNIPLKYEAMDELINLIEESGRLENAADFDLWGDTVIYTPHGEEVHQNIVSIESFRPDEKYFCVCFMSDNWLPMVKDKDDLIFSWNLEQYNQNYHRIPAFLKKLNTDLEWDNSDLLKRDDFFVTVQAGYDFFLKEDVISWEYKMKPNPEFDLNAYLAAMKKAKEQYS
jgi:hypothetical protein